MKFYIIALLLAVFMLIGCDIQPSSAELEHTQQEGGQKALIQNQPVPTLSYSMERHLLSEIYLARNRKVATWTYTRDMQGNIMEICPSIGFPIPYATQLTNPLQTKGDFDQGTAIGNPEPSGLYAPSSAEGTWVACVDKDGSITPTYWEDRVFAMPYRIKAKLKLERADDEKSSFSVTIK